MEKPHQHSFHKQPYGIIMVRFFHTDRKVTTTISRHRADFTAAKHCKKDGVAKRDSIDSMSRKQQVSFINEANLYRLVTRSRIPNAYTPPYHYPVPLCTNPPLYSTIMHHPTSIRYHYAPTKPRYRHTFPLSNICQNPSHISQNNEAKQAVSVDFAKTA